MAQPVAQCPRCHQTMVANVQQVFDLAKDPEAKEKLLSGQFNTAFCTACGYTSPLGTPLVYHDPEKQLFLSYYPAELNTPLPEQERILGQLIRSVVDSLPMEKRGGYLFQPRAMYTYDTLIDTILEADGITKEMVREQERKIRLLQELLSADDASIPTIVDRELSSFDADFFAILSNIQGNAASTQDEKLLNKLHIIQDELLSKTEYGQTLKKRAESTHQALTDLQALGEALNRDSLLELVVKSPDDDYLRTIVGLTRNGMDAKFFDGLKEKEASASGDEKARLTEIHGTISTLIREIDKSIQEQRQLRKQALEAILKTEPIEKGIEQFARALDDAFIEIAEEELSLARENSDFERSGKIQNLLSKIDEMMKIPPEIEFLQALMKIEDMDELAAAIESNKNEVTPEFREMLTNVIANVSQEKDQDPLLLEKLNRIQSILNGSGPSA